MEDMNQTVWTLKTMELFTFDTLLPAEMASYRQKREQEMVERWFDDLRGRHAMDMGEIKNEILGQVRNMGKEIILKAD